MSYNCYCDYDIAEFYHRELRKARKPHKCCECAGTIRVGELYEHAIGKWEGSMQTYDTCERCVDIWQWAHNNLPCLCWAHGNRIEDCRNAIEDATFRASEETAGLRFGFLRRLVVRDKHNKTVAP